MRRAVLLLVLVALAAAGVFCGKKGPPHPPEPRGPLPPGQVEARQVGSAAWVFFTMPRPRGQDPAQRPSRVEVIRVEYPPDSHPASDPDAFRRRGRVVATQEGASLEPGSRVGLEDPTAGSLPGGGAGSTLRYGVRVLDRKGRLSPLVVARDLVLVEPPPPPSRLRAEATSDGVRLEWQPPEGGGGFRYNLYRAPAGEPFGERPVHLEPLPVPEYLDSDVISGRSYTYMVRTSASEAPQYRESISCPAVTVLAEDRFAPSAPERLVAVQEGRAVRLFWNPNPEKDLAGYRVYRRGEADTWARVGPDLVEQPLYLDDSVTVGQHLAYRVTAVDRASPPNESAPSEDVEVDVGEEPELPADDHP